MAALKVHVESSFTPPIDWSSDGPSSPPSAFSRFMLGIVRPYVRIETPLTPRPLEFARYGRPYSPWWLNAALVVGAAVAIVFVVRRAVR